MSEPTSAHDYTQPDAVITYVDAAGEVTTDKAKAVGGEIVHRLPGGRMESILFTMDDHAGGPPTS